MKGSLEYIINKNFKKLEKSNLFCRGKSSKNVSFHGKTQNFYELGLIFYYLIFFASKYDRIEKNTKEK